MLEIIEIKIAPKNADQNPLILKESVRRSVIRSMAVFTTNSDKPRVRKAKGKVSTFKIVPKVALINAKTTPIIK